MLKKAKNKFSLSIQQEIDILTNLKVQKVIGIDEVGRGCLAGGLCVCAFVVDKEKIESSLVDPIVQINDSKKLTKNAREESSKFLTKFEHKIQYATVQDIVNFGISRCIEEIIAQIVDSFSFQNAFFLIDGVFKRDFGSNTKKIIKGDSNFFSIASASIIAKVERDRYMQELNKEIPIYDWNFNMGYGTKKHIESIEKFGISKYHRVSFCRRFL